MLLADQLTLAYQDTVIMEQVSLPIPERQITVLIGANGCGKSTLLQSLARMLPPQHGTVMLNGSNIYQQRGKRVSRQLAILAQSTAQVDDVTVGQLVRYGRYPYHSLFSRWREEDEQHVQAALRLTQTENLVDKPLACLSGGQRQRVWIAMVLAQDTPYVLLDEPTTYLDLSYQIEILDLLQQINREHHKTIVMVLHDLNLACRYAHHIVALKDRQIYATGAPADIITTANVEHIFGLRSQIITDPFHGTPICIPMSASTIKEHAFHEQGEIALSG